ncbi:hypothetical protein EON64_12170 [archaeon]|nr:MAG: hypothetical protein EON64_12170 [archaeon]
MLYYCFIFASIVCYVCGKSSLVATFIIRDEEVNLRSNLPLWAQFTDYFAFLVDYRTIDGSVKAINQILEPKNISYVIQNYSFSGFGEARSASLELAYKHFSKASHVMIADPDWKPSVETIDKAELDDSALVFRFMVFDRSGETRRYIDWCLLHRPGLKMRYALHEVLDIGHYAPKRITWVFHEIEQLGTWHKTVGHGELFPHF